MANAIGRALIDHLWSEGNRSRGSETLQRLGHLSSLGALDAEF